MDWFIIHDLADRILLLLIALLVACIATGPLRLHKTLRLDRPGNWLRRFVTRAEKKLNRENRSAGKRVYRGMILTLFVSITITAIALAVTHLSARWYYGDFVEIALLAALIPIRHIWDQSQQIANLLKKQKSDQANIFAASTTQRNLKQRDDHALCRIAIEHMAVNMSDKVIAPILAYLLLGLPGAIFIRSINLIDSVIGHKSKHYLAFGWTAAKLDDLLQIIPARLCAFIIILASMFIPKCHPIKALITIAKDRRKTSSPNSGWPLAATAGALNVSLSGSRNKDEGTNQGLWIGGGSAKVTLHDLRRGLWLYVASSLIIIMAIASGLMLTIH